MLLRNDPIALAGLGGGVAAIAIAASWKTKRPPDPPDPNLEECLFSSSSAGVTYLATMALVALGVVIFIGLSNDPPPAAAARDGTHRAKLTPINEDARLQSLKKYKNREPLPVDESGADDDDAAAAPRHHGESILLVVSKILDGW